MNFLSRSMAFAIKAQVNESQAKTFTFTAQKTMYGGKHIAKGDTIFVFASENEGGQGLIAPRAELNFKFYRQASNKIVGLSDDAVALLSEFF